MTTRRTALPTAGTWIRRLRLRPHPEGGYYRETYRAAETVAAAALPPRYDGPRAYATAIYFLLRSGEISRLHRLRSDELWHFYRGSPLTLHLCDTRGGYRTIRLGAAIAAGETPQACVPAGVWFGATVDEPHTYALVGCTVAPGFDFRDFELARRRVLLAAYPRQRAIIARLTSRGKRAQLR